MSTILMISDSGNSDADDVCLHGTDTSDYDQCRAILVERASATALWYTRMKI